MTGTKRRSGGARPGNLNGTRGRGSKKNVGATVRNIELDSDAALSSRIICAALYGDARKSTVTRYVNGLVRASWQEWDAKAQKDAETASEGEAQ